MATSAAGGRGAAILASWLAASLLAAGWAQQALGEQTRVPMWDNGAATFYVAGHIDGFGDVDMLVDTGSGYLTINEAALSELKANGKVEYVKMLQGILANGQELRVPVYRLARVRIGERCDVTNVPAAVFPGTSRFILGLSALQRTAPFSFSVEPPELSLSNCTSLPAAPDARLASADAD